MRTRFFVSANAEVYPWSSGDAARREAFPEDFQTSIGRTGFLTREAAEAARDEWVAYQNGEISECEYEFGPHTDHSDCQRTLDEMSAEPWDDGYAEAYNREAEEMSLGRPLFPNEY